MAGLIITLPAGILCWIGIIALAIRSPFLFEVGACIIGICACGIALIAGALTADRLFPIDEERL